MIDLTKLTNSPYDRDLFVLLSYVRQLEIEPGDRLPSIKEIAETIGLNQSQVRSAVLKASALGIIEVRPRSGNYLQRFDFSRVLDLFTLMIAMGDADNRFQLIHIHDLKTVLEKGTFAAAARSATDEEIHELGMYVEENERTEDVERLIDIDEQIHVLIARMSRNPFSVTLLQIINAILRKDRLENVEYAVTKDQTVRDHQLMYHAILDRDVERAVQLAEKHGDRRKRRLMDKNGARYDQWSPTGSRGQRSGD
jgi:DNA-binding FadR family transcriptional regulator